MKKIFILFFSVLYSYIFCIEDIKIGISPPYKKNTTSFTVFYNKQFIFEFLANYENEDYKIEIINPIDFNSENEYYEKAIEMVFEKEVDYLLFSVVYEIDTYFIFKVILIDPYNENIIFNKMFKEEKVSFFNEKLLLNINELIKILKDISLQKVYKKNIFNKKNIKKKEEDLFSFENKDLSKHEIFVQNGFLKIQPKIMSFFNYYIGYNFTPFKFFKIEGTFFLGSGDLISNFEFKSNNYFSNFFFGTYGAFYFFLSGFFIEPFAGCKIELSYIVNDFVYFYLPIDFGIRIFVSKKDCIRIDSNFQFSAFNINKLIWENFFIIGFLIGYARKI